MYKTKLTQEDFESRISDRTFKALEPYAGSRVRIVFKCSVCDGEWKARPDKIFAGQGCPHCAKKLKVKNLTGNGPRPKTKEEVVAILADKNPSVLIVGHYENSYSTARFRCKRCGATWNTTAANVINRGTGCPACNRGKCFGHWVPKTDEKFKMQIESRMVNALDEYQGEDTPIEFECDECLETFIDTPRNVLAGRECDECRLSAIDDMTTNEDGSATINIHRDGCLPMLITLDLIDALYLKAQEVEVFAKWTPKSGLRAMVWDYEAGRSLSVANYITKRKEPIMFIDGDSSNITRSNLKELF